MELLPGTRNLEVLRALGSIIDQGLIALDAAGTVLIASDRALSWPSGTTPQSV